MASLGVGCIVPASNEGTTGATVGMVAGDPRGYYAILGIGRTASAGEIRAAFRERAKQFHPDGSGSQQDEARFRHLREAFETLRDPQRRVRYDTESLRAGTSSQADEQRFSNAEDIGAAALLTKARQLAGESWAALRRLAASAPAMAIALAATVLVMLVLGGLAWQRLTVQDQAIKTLTQRVEAAVQALAERDRQAAAASVSEPEQVRFAGEIVFLRGLAELAPASRARADQTIGGLRQAIAALPPRSEWTVAIVGQARRLGADATSATATWELTARRLGAVGEYLIHQGVPAGRIEARFSAGDARADLPSVPEALQVRLLCCGKGAAGS